MLSIELRSLDKEFPDQKTVAPEGWVEWRALNLYDNQNKQRVSEWFYIAACSHDYVDKPNNSAANDEIQKMVVQREFDEIALISVARRRFEALSFENWDDFYEKMSRVFVYED